MAMTTFDQRRFWAVLVAGVCGSAVLFAAVGLFEMRPAVLGGAIFTAWMFGLFVVAKYAAGWRPGGVA